MGDMVGGFNNLFLYYSNCNQGLIPKTQRAGWALATICRVVPGLEASCPHIRTISAAANASGVLLTSNLSSIGNGNGVVLNFPEAFSR